MTPDTSALVLIDLQEKLTAIMKYQEQTIRNCRILVSIAKALGIPILCCRQVPRALGQTVEPIRSMLEGDSLYDKSSFSCYEHEKFAHRLSEINPEWVVLCGIESHVCVYQTGRDLLNKGHRIQVIADAVDSRTDENRQIGLDRMAALGAVISSTEMFLFEMLRDSTHPLFKKLSALIK